MNFGHLNDAGQLVLLAGVINQPGPCKEVPKFVDTRFSVPEDTDTSQVVSVKQEGEEYKAIGSDGNVIELSLTRLDDGDEAGDGNEETNLLLESGNVWVAVNVNDGSQSDTSDEWESNLNEVTRVVGDEMQDENGNAISTSYISVVEAAPTVEETETTATAIEEEAAPAAEPEVAAVEEPAAEVEA